LGEMYRRSIPREDIPYDLSQMSGWRSEALSATGWNQAPI
jgi:hypothetical protein